MTGVRKRSLIHRIYAVHYTLGAIGSQSHYSRYSIRHLSGERGNVAFSRQTILVGRGRFFTHCRLGHICRVPNIPGRRSKCIHSDERACFGCRIRSWHRDSVQTSARCQRQSWKWRLTARSRADAPTSSASLCWFYRGAPLNANVRAHYPMSRFLAII